MKFTRKQEIALIELGLNQLLEKLSNGESIPHKRGPYKKKFTPWNKGKSGTRWTPERRAKFKETMRKKWQGKKTAQKD